MDRPLAEPDCFSFRELDGRASNDILGELHELWHGQPEEVRITLVNDDFPNPPYPHGLYFEGWSVAPYRMDPPHQAAPFNFPLTAARKGGAE